MMKLKVICSFSHDSIFLGEDGPTHQPIEQLAMFRAMPNVLVIRPADITEIKFAWVAALTHQGPTVLALARQVLPDLQLAQDYEHTVKRGAYIIRDVEDPEVVIYASGSEVKIALDVYNLLRATAIKVRVISVPCFELFDQQTLEYQAKILYHQAKVSISIEAAHGLSWYKFIGKDGIMVCVNEYGVADAPQKVANKFGFSPPQIVNLIKDKLISS